MSDKEKTVEKLQEELTNAVKDVKDLLEKQDKEIKAHGTTTEKTVNDLKAAEKRLDEANGELKIKAEELAQKADDLAAKGDEQAKRIDELEAKMNRPGFMPGGEEVKTPGQIFCESEQFKEAQAHNRKTTEFVQVKDLFGYQRKQVVGDLGYALTPVQPMRVPGFFFDPGQREMTIRDVMNVAPTTSNSIEYVSETTYDEDGADAQKEEGYAKEEADMGFALNTVSVSTIPYWIPASRQVLDDAPMLQSHIDSRLVYGIRKKEEDHILFGDGTQGRMLGIHNNPGVQTIGLPAGTDTAIDHLRRAIAQVRVSEYYATAMVLHPLDWAEIELLKGTDDRYVWVTVPIGGVKQLWRVPVIETTAMEEGRFLVGAFGLGAQLFDRQQAQIRVSEHHAEYFTHNMVAILAELRVALVVYRPRAFVKGILDASLST